MSGRDLEHDSIENLILNQTLENHHGWVPMKTELGDNDPNMSRTNIVHDSTEK